MTDIKLVTNKICPFAHRAWITLLESGEPFELVEVDLKNKSEYFSQTYTKAYAHDPSSNGKVPVLIHGNKYLAESDLVSWYLAETLPKASHLIPEDTFRRAQMRHFIQEMPGKLIAAFGAFMQAKGKQGEELTPFVEAVNKVFDLFETKIQGPFILGKEFTLADIMIYPWFERFGVLAVFFKVSIDGKYKRIHEWLNNVQNRDSVKNHIMPVEYYVDAFRGYFEAPKTAA